MERIASSLSKFKHQLFGYKQHKLANPSSPRRLNYMQGSSSLPKAIAWDAVLSAGAKALLLCLKSRTNWSHWVIDHRLVDLWGQDNGVFKIKPLSGHISQQGMAAALGMARNTLAFQLQELVLHEYLSDVVCNEYGTFFTLTSKALTEAELRKFRGGVLKIRAQVTNRSPSYTNKSLVRSYVGNNAPQKSVNYGGIMGVDATQKYLTEIYDPPPDQMSTANKAALDRILGRK